MEGKGKEKERKGRGRGGEGGTEGRRGHPRFLPGLTPLPEIIFMLGWISGSPIYKSLKKESLRTSNARFFLTDRTSFLSRNQQIQNTAVTSKCTYLPRDVHKTPSYHSQGLCRHITRCHKVGVSKTTEVCPLTHSPEMHTCGKRTQHSSNGHFPG